MRGPVRVLVEDLPRRRSWTVRSTALRRERPVRSASTRYSERRCAKQTQSPASDRSGHKWGTRRRSCRWDRRYKQSQFADTDRDGRGPAKAPPEPSLGAIAPNEPNLPRTGRKRHCPATAASTAGPGGNRAKHSQSPARAGMGWARTGKVAQAGPAGAKACETNPISTGAIGRVGTLRQTSYDKSDTQPASAKQSQCPPEPRWARAGEAARAAGGTQRTKQDACVKSPQVRLRPAFLGQYQGSVRLIPTLGGRVKQSQFPGSGRHDRYGMDYCEPIQLRSGQAQRGNPPRQASPTRGYRVLLLALALCGRPSHNRAGRYQRRSRTSPPAGRSCRRRPPADTATAGRPAWLRVRASSYPDPA